MPTYDTDDFWKDDPKHDNYVNAKHMWKKYVEMSEDPSTLFTNLIGYLPYLTSLADGHILIFYADGDVLYNQMHDVAFEKYAPLKENYLSDTDCDNAESRLFLSWTEGI